MQRLLLGGMALAMLGFGCVSTPRTVVSQPIPSRIDAAPPITIEEPISNAMVESPLPAWGKGIAFENTIQLRLRDADGRVLARTFATAFSPNYEKPGPWTAMIEFTPPSPEITSGFLEAFESSAKDGSELHVTRIPVRFR